MNDQVDHDPALYSEQEFYYYILYNPQNEMYVGENLREVDSFRGSHKYLSETTARQALKKLKERGAGNYIVERWLASFTKRD